jgi:Tfp pilus assembly protein PilO
MCSSVAHYSAVVRYLITIFALSALVFFWHKGPHQWLTNYKQQIDANKISIEKMIQANFHDSQCMQTLNESCLTLKREIAQLKYLVNKQANDCPFSVVGSAQDHGLTIESCSNQYEKEKDWCLKKGFTYTFKGTFEQLFNFLSSLDAQKKIIRCKDLSLEKNGDMLRAHLVFETIIIKDEAHV